MFHIFVSREMKFETPTRITDPATEWPECKTDSSVCGRGRRRTRSSRPRWGGYEAAQPIRKAVWRVKHSRPCPGYSPPDRNQVGTKCCTHSRRSQRVPNRKRRVSTPTRSHPQTRSLSCSREPRAANSRCAVWMSLRAVPAAGRVQAEKRAQCDAAALTGRQF